MRKLKEDGGGSAVMPAENVAPARPQVRRPAADVIRPRREVAADDFSDESELETAQRGSGRHRRIRRGLIPQTRTGWIAAGVGTAFTVALCAAAAFLGARYALGSPKFRIPSSQNITLAGNTHVTRAQMLSIFGGDVDRSIFRVPMEQRRAQLEAMPWVEHATVMRLLPNRLRVDVTERVPVAFARQGSAIGLVDRDGVLLDIPADAGGGGTYTFPVVTGVRADGSAEGRAERMKLYTAFLKDMDSDGKGTSAQLSEIDLANPEDVKALIPDHNSEILVHFGTDHFLERYRRFQEHVTEWRTQYPRLSGVDMRYDRQVVLQMPPKDPPLGMGSSPAAETHGTEPAAPAAAVHRQARAAGTVLRPAAAVAQPARVKPPDGLAGQDAATRKRVEAIRAWMAKREQQRAAAKSSAN